MKKMNRPNFDTKKIIEKCVENMRDENKKNNFLKATSDILDCQKNFEYILENNIDTKFSNKDLSSHGLKKDDLTDLYSDKFSKKGELARSLYYDKLMISAEHGKCPFCGVGTVSNLDHFLLKSDYYALAVSPTNLVPICRDCNSGGKGQNGFDYYRESHLHPYYDDVDNDIWLKCHVFNESGEIGIKYFIEPPAHWVDILKKRLENHFKLFKLKDVFTTSAINEIENNKHKWIQLKDKIGTEELKKDLYDSLQSFEKIALNGWRQALYRELMNNNFFLDDFLS